jgi:hypothetical protein
MYSEHILTLPKYGLTGRSSQIYHIIINKNMIRAENELNKLKQSLRLDLTINSLDLVHEIN